MQRSVARLALDSLRSLKPHYPAVPRAGSDPFPDAVQSVLQRSDTITQCPYTGGAQHWHLQVEDRRVCDAAWTLPEPFGEADAIRAYFSFYPAKVEVSVDDERLDE